MQNSPRKLAFVSLTALMTAMASGQGLAQTLSQGVGSDFQTRSYWTGPRMKNAGPIELMPAGTRGSFTEPSVRAPVMELPGSAPTHRAEGLDVQLYNPDP